MQQAELLEQLKQPRILADLTAGCVAVLGLFGCFHPSPPVKTLSLATLMAGIGTLGANTLLANLYAESAATVLEKELLCDRTRLETAHQTIDTLNAKVQEWQTFWQQQHQEFNVLKNRLVQERQALAQALERSSFETSELREHTARLQSNIDLLQQRINALTQQRDQERHQFYLVLSQLTENAKGTLSEIVTQWEDGLTSAIAHSLRKRSDLGDRLSQIKAEVRALAVSYQQQIHELSPLGEPAHLVNEILSLLHHAVTEFAALKVKYRNALNVGDSLRYQAQIAGYQTEIIDLKQTVDRLQKDTIPRSQHEAILTEFQIKKDQAFSELVFQAESLENELQTDTDQYVQKLIHQLEQATHQIANLQTRVQDLTKPQSFAPATRDDMRMGNVVIAYFETLGITLDRAYSDYRKWEAVLHFHSDRNRKVILTSELNEHSERLRQLLNCLNEIKFDYDAEQGLMRLRVQIAAKPKADSSEIHKLWKRATQFEAIVSKWERVRVTGGSEAGKSPTAENIAVCILKNRSGIVKLANPMHDSRKNYWTIPVSWRSHSEAVTGLKELADCVKKRSTAEESREVFALYVFDEVDSTMEQNKSAPSLIKTSIKQVSHQNLGAIFIGQNANATNYKGMDRSDWNNAVNVHIGANAYDAITNSNQFTAKEQTELKERADRLTEFCQEQNQQLGFEPSDPEAYRFALVIEPNKKPYFIELPAFGRYTFDQVKPSEILDANGASELYPAASIGMQAVENPHSSVASEMASAPYIGMGCPKCNQGILSRAKKNRNSLLYVCDTCDRWTSESVLASQQQLSKE